MFNTPYNFVFSPDMGEFNEEPSLTVPDMSYSIQEMVEKFVRGQALPVNARGGFDDEASVLAFETDPTRSGDFDLTDSIDMAMELEDIQARLADRKNRAVASGKAQDDLKPAERSEEGGKEA